MSTVDTTILSKGWTVTDAGDGKYATKRTAVDVLNYCVNSIPFFNGGAHIDPYAELLNYKSEGIGLPSGLKAALASQSANVPVAGVFRYYFAPESSYYIAVFYVDQID